MEERNDFNLEERRKCLTTSNCRMSAVQEREVTQFSLVAECTIMIKIKKRQREHFQEKENCFFSSEKIKFSTQQTTRRN